MASKGVRCGPHPKYAATARDMEKWIIDKIDHGKARLSAVKHDSTGLGVARPGPKRRGSTRPGIARQGRIRRSKTRPGGA